MKVLITGGAGFIGSTVATACLDAGIMPVILDDFSTGRPEFVADRLSYQGDIADAAVLDQVFAEHPDIAATIHCAAKIVVPESVADPLGYYDNNVAKTFALVGHLLRPRLHPAAVQLVRVDLRHPAPTSTVDETSALAPASPYARSKSSSSSSSRTSPARTGLRVLSLRYFNPIGADPLLRTGLQLAPPTPRRGQAARGPRSREPFRVTGVDYDDPRRLGDPRLHPRLGPRAGPRRRAAAHGPRRRARPALPINVGTGNGTTVRELVEAFRRSSATGCSSRRPTRARAT